MVTITKIGTGWKQFPKYLRGYSRNLPLFEKHIIQSVAEKYIATLHKRIEDQPKDVPPLAQSTVAKKLREGNDPRIWIETGYFKKNLKIIQIRKGEIFAGASMKKKHPSGKTMAELADLLEYGDPEENLLPRPLFRPVEKTFKKSWQYNMARASVKFFGSGGKNVF